MGFNIEGFYVDDAEVTLNVCLGQEFSGGELFFRGVRCEKHVNTETQAEDGRMTIGDQACCIQCSLLASLQMLLKMELADLDLTCFGAAFLMAWIFMISLVI